MRSRNQRSWRDDHGAARERLQARLERSQRIHVKVVGRFVKQQHVAAGLQQLGEMHPVALTTRQLADELLLVGATEVEG